MTTSKFIIIFLFVPLFSQCQQGHYSKLGTEGGTAFMTLNSNNTYEYLWYRYYDVGPIDDTISHKGTWKKNGDTLILNSYYTPSNYEFLKIEKEEEQKQNDSIIVFITSFDTIPFFFIAPKQIRINDTHYSINFINKNSIRFAIPRTQVNYIVIPGYPIYNSKSKNSNYFHFSIKELSGTKFMFSENTFFLNEKFLAKGDTLYQLWNHKKMNDIIFVKNK